MQLRHSLTISWQRSDLARISLCSPFCLPLCYVGQTQTYTCERRPGGCLYFTLSVSRSGISHLRPIFLLKLLKTAFSISCPLGAGYQHKCFHLVLLGLDHCKPDLTNWAFSWQAQAALVGSTCAVYPVPKDNLESHRTPAFVAAKLPP